MSKTKTEDYTYSTIEEYERNEKKTDQALSAIFAKYFKARRLSVKKIEKIIKEYIKPPEINDRFKPTIEGCCILCGYPLDKKLWNRKIRPLASAIQTYYKKMLLKNTSGKERHK